MEAYETKTTKQNKNTKQEHKTLKTNSKEQTARKVWACAKYAPKHTRWKKQDTNGKEKDSTCKGTWKKSMIPNAQTNLKHRQRAKKTNYKTPAAKKQIKVHASYNWAKVPYMLRWVRKILEMGGHVVTAAKNIKFLCACDACITRVLPEQQQKRRRGKTKKQKERFFSGCCKS